jgi:hypothetical protein
MFLFGSNELDASKQVKLMHGFQNLSIKDLARAVNSMCWWIEGNIGQAQSPETDRCRKQPFPMELHVFVWIK